MELGAARGLGGDRERVARWRDRFLAGGVEAPRRDRPRSGYPKPIPLEREEEVATLARTTVPEGATRWSVRTTAKASGLSPAAVRRIWASRGLKPHLVRAFEPSQGPDFERKLVDVVGL